MLGIFLVIAGVVLAAYLVIKRYYAPWVLEDAISVYISVA